MGTTNIFSPLGCMILMLCVCKKSFSFCHFPCNYYSSMKWDKLGCSLQSLFFSLWALQSCSPHWDTRSWCFRFARKGFLSTIFIIINVHPWNESNMDARNYLYSFHYGHYNHILPIVMHDINAFGLQEKLFFPPFSL